MTPQDHAEAIAAATDSAYSTRTGTVADVRAALMAAHRHVHEQGETGDSVARELEYASTLHRAYERTLTTAQPRTAEKRLQSLATQTLAMSRAINQTVEAVAALRTLD